MPTDYAALSENLSRFYNFTDKSVLFIGAGGRQLLDPATKTRRMFVGAGRVRMSVNSQGSRGGVFVGSVQVSREAVAQASTAGKGS